MSDLECRVPRFDLIAMGRALVDLYGEQLGCRLEEVASFARFVGGSPTNVAIGASRLGLRVAMITRVGNDHNGRFIRETLVREGVNVEHVVTDPSRLTAVAFLSIRSAATFPLLHYRKEPADLGISPADYTEDFLKQGKALLVTGGHLVTRAAVDNVMFAVGCARRAGVKVVFDIDYRPVFWEVTQLDDGENRSTPSQAATGATQAVLEFCDLVVGTEEEICIAGSSVDVKVALRNIRRRTKATIVMKRGAEGCVVFGDQIPEDFNEAHIGHPFRVEVLNVLGAGDGFLAGWLYGWLSERPVSECSTTANACGALVASRHGCSVASPTRTELEQFLRDAHNGRGPNKDLLRRIHREAGRAEQTSPRIVIDVTETSGEGAETAIWGDRHHELFAFAREIVGQYVGATGKIGVIVPDKHQLIPHQPEGDWSLVMRRITTGKDDPRSAATFGAEFAVGVRKWPPHHVASVIVNVDRKYGLEKMVANQLPAVQTALWEYGIELSVRLKFVDELRELQTLRVALDAINRLEIYPDWWEVESEKYDFDLSSLQSPEFWGKQIGRGFFLVVTPQDAVRLRWISSVQGASDCRAGGLAIGASRWSEMLHSASEREI